MNQLNNEKNNNKDKKLSVKNLAIFGAITFALLATMIPSSLFVNAFELNAGDGGSGGDGGEGGDTGENGIFTGDGGDGGTGGSGGSGGNGGSNNTVFDVVEPFDAILENTTGISLSGALSADGGDGGFGGNADGGETSNSGNISTGNADGGEAGSGGDGGNAIAICNTLGCI